MDLDSILEKVKRKAHKLVNEANSILLQNNFELSSDELAKKLTDRSIKRQSQFSDPVLTIEVLRVSADFISQIYEKTQLKPCLAKYWFYDDLRMNPLIQVDYLNDDKTKAVPIAALCISEIRAILNNSKIVPNYIKENAEHLSKTPSHKWSLGHMSQLTRLTCSYILGFNLGYSDNTPGCKNCSKEFHQGFEDGFKIRQEFLNQKLIEEDLVDPFENEQNPDKISELIRVGYFKETHGPDQIT